MSLECQYMKKTPGEMGEDLPRESEESFFDTFVDLRRSLDELDSEFLGQLTALLLCDSSLIRPIRFVANKNLVNALRSMLFDVCVPSADV